MIKKRELFLLRKLLTLASRFLLGNSLFPKNIFLLGGIVLVDYTLNELFTSFTDDFLVTFLLWTSEIVLRFHRMFTFLCYLSDATMVLTLFLLCDGVL